jgi:hypothetical protein
MNLGGPVSTGPQACGVLAVRGMVPAETAVRAVPRIADLHEAGVPCSRVRGLKGGRFALDLRAQDTRTGDILPTGARA